MYRLPPETRFSAELQHVWGRKSSIQDVSRRELLDFADENREMALARANIYENEAADIRKFIEELDSCLESPGLRGVGGPKFSIRINSWLPRVPTDKPANCPRQAGEGTYVWERVGGDLVCQYCGSADVSTVLRVIDEHGTDAISLGKPGKVYIQRPNIPNASFGAIKFYSYHATAAELAEINQKLKAG